MLTELAMISKRQALYRAIRAVNTKEDADKIIAAYREQDERDLSHKRTLEIAEAGRVKNFWGK